MECHASYHTKIIHHECLKQVVKVAIKELRKPFYKDVVAIAAKGHSGIPLAAILSYELNLSPIYVRCAASERHDCLTVTSPLHGEGHLCSRYVIVDDFIGSGETMRNIVSQITEYNIFANPHPLAIFLHDTHRDNGDWPIGDGVTKLVNIGKNIHKS